MFGFDIILAGLGRIGVIAACSSAVRSSLLYLCTPLVSVSKSITAGLAIRTALSFNLPL